MFVSISSKKKQPEKPSLSPALNLSGPQPSPKGFQKVRFADEEPVRNQVGNFYALMKIVINIESIRVLIVIFYFR